MPKSHRLSPDVRPERYAVHLRARVDRPEFDGDLVLALRLARSTATVELNARDLDVTSVEADAGGRTLRGTVAAVDAESETVRLAFPDPLPAGAATLRLSWRGKVGRGLKGLYLSTDGAESCLATQCEEADARAIFPCFDEPSFKAKLQWTVTTDPSMVVLANGALAKVERGDGEATWTFQETPVMSTYLAALAIGKFASTPETRVGGVPMRVWAMEGKEPLGKFGLDLGARLLPWFGNYFGQPYPFGKYDQLAVPGFSAGAMENAGLVLFRASLLLHDPKTTSWRQEKVIAKVVAHEMAHMWFGNLVTMAWWDDIWLNESFAEWIAHKAVDRMEPGYAVWDDAHADKRRAMESDALLSTHAIYAPVASPHEVTELFDAITYEKGAAVMRMLEGFLGEEAFRDGLRAYMRDFAYRNAKGAELWRHLETASKRPVARLMESWVLQGGFPVVGATLDGTTLRLSQKRFLAAPAESPKQTWLVPLVVKHADDAGVHETRHLLEGPEGELKLSVQGTLRWVHLNAGSMGYYRQDLSDDLRARLAEHVDDLAAPEQMDLLEDAWALARTGTRPLAPALDLLVRLLARAKSHVVLALAHERLREVEVALLDDADALARLRGLVRDALAPEAARLGWTAKSGEPRDDAERRAIVLEALGSVARDEAALRAALDLADREERDPIGVDATLAGPALRVAARVADDARLDRLLRAYDERRKAARPPSIADRPLNALPGLGDERLARKVLDAERAGAFPLQAVGPLLRAMLWEPRVQDAAWTHLKTDWSRLRQGLGDQWMAFLVAAAGHLGPRHLDDMRAFFETTVGDVARQSAARALEDAAARGAFRAKAARDARAWLAQR